MDFIHAHSVEFLIGLVGSLAATAIVAIISYTRKWPPLPVPLWVIALLIASPMIGFAMVHLTPLKPIPILNQKFETQRVILDGKQFIRCKFDRCVLVFKGEAPFGLEGCEFTAPKLTFEGNAAITAFEIGILRSDPSFEPSMEAAIKKR